MNVFANISAAVLLGGQSKRMGVDKAHLELAGTPSVVRISKLLSELFQEILLVGGTPCAEAPGSRVEDPPGPQSSLRGLVGALDAAQCERVLVVATDLPLVTPELILALVAWPSAQAVVPKNAEGAQPLFAIYEREPALTKARTRLAKGELSLRSLLDDLETSYIEAEDLARIDPAGTGLLNMNTPEDRKQIEALLPADS